MPETPIPEPATFDDVIENTTALLTQLTTVIYALDDVQLPLNLNPNRSGLERAHHLIATELESMVGASQVIAQELPLGPLPEPDEDRLLPPGARIPLAPSTRQLGYMARLANTGVSIGTYRDLIERTAVPLPDRSSPTWPRRRRETPVSDDARDEYDDALARAANPIDCGPSAWLTAIAEQSCPRCGAEPTALCRTNTGNPIELQDSHAGRKKPAHAALGWTNT